MLIDCPFCGLRDHSEFQYGGDATKVMPPLDNKPKNWQAWYDYVYLRDNPKGDHVEYWHHVHGCGHWVKVKRNTVTHDISEVLLACKNTD